MTNMVKILFVCHGNICRSPMAEFVMKQLVREKFTAGFAQNLNALQDNYCTLTASDFEIASAATSTEEIGNPVYPPARRMLANHGIDCSGKKARQMTIRDYEYYDYIVLMDQNNLRNLRWILPHDAYEREIAALQNPGRKNAVSNRIGSGKISLLMEWAGINRDVADPWYTGDFDATWRDVNAGCIALLKYICG